MLGILPCLNWLCCTNCSPHCVSVSLSLHLCLAFTLFELTVLHCSPHVCLYHCELVLGILPCLNWLCCSSLCVCITVGRPFLDMSLCLASYPVWTDCAALIVLLIVCLYHCRPTITGHELDHLTGHCAALIVLLIAWHLVPLPCLNWLCWLCVSALIVLLTVFSSLCVCITVRRPLYAWHLTLFELTVLH